MDPGTPAETGQRNPRLRREELQQLLLATGVKILHEEGLSDGGHNLTYADAFRRFESETGVKVSRAQVHGRIWDSVEDYRSAVLARLATYELRKPSEATNGALAKVLETADLTSPEGRLETMREMIRVAARANADAVHSGDGEFIGTLWSLQTVALQLGNAKPQIVEALGQSRRRLNSEFESLYRGLLNFLGLGLNQRMQPVGITEVLGLFTQLANAYSEGFAARWAFDREPLVGITIKPSPTSKPLEWDVFSLGVLALADVFFSAVDTNNGGETPAHTPFAADAGDTLTGLENVRPNQQMSREVLMHAMTDAGAKVLCDIGLGHGAEHLTYARVFERLQADTGISVARAQVHGRIWDSQLDFQNDVLVQVVTQDFTEHLAAFQKKIAPKLAAIDLTGDVEDRRANVHRLVREYAHVRELQMTDSVQGQLWSGVARLHVLRDDRPESVEHAIAQGYRDRTKLWAGFFAGLAATFRANVRTGLGLGLQDACTVMSKIAMGLAEGVAKQKTLIPGALEHIELPTGPNGETENWSGLSLGVMSLVEFFLEFDENPSLSS